MNFSLPAYGAQFIVFSSRKAAPPSTSSSSLVPAPVDLSKDWDVSFKNASYEPNPAPRHFATLTDWTADASLKYFSGVATYEKSIVLPADQIMAVDGSARKMYLDFGAGTPTVVPGSPSENSVRANFQPPIGDAAVVFVNGMYAGTLWCPPYRVDVTDVLKPGTNQFRIQVANRAVNYMADFEHHPLPDYTTLISTYPPKRFDAQDMNVIQTMPSGILGTVQLTATSN